QGRGYQTAPKIIKELPERERGKRILLATPARARNPRQQPRYKLPIPTNPTAAAAHVRAILRRIFLVQLHIAQQPRPRVAPFEKIVAEYPVLGETPLQRPLERIDIIDPLANERTLSEQILVNVGDNASIRIDAWLTSEQACISRMIRSGQARADLGLKDAVPIADPLLVVVVARTIQRMRHSSD